MTRLSILLLTPLLIIAACLTFVGCGGGASLEPAFVLKGDGAAGGNGGENDKEFVFQDPGNIVGTIMFEGSAPSLSPRVPAGASVKDKEYCSVNAVPNESLVVGGNGGLANVFIYLDKAPDWYKHTPPEEAMTIDQKGCKFTPHAFLSQVGQTVNIINSDGCAHNTNIGFVSNRKFNGTINANDATGVPIVPEKAEKIPVKTVCDFHNWMECFVFVVDHPFAAVTDENGKFEIKGLQPGKYTFRVWHETGDLLERKLEVTIESNQDTPVDLKYSLGNFKL